MDTGFKDLDDIVQIDKGDLVVVASRPGMGKTSFVCNILSYIAIDIKQRVLFMKLKIN